MAGWIDAALRTAGGRAEVLLGRVIHNEANEGIGVPGRAALKLGIQSSGLRPHAFRLNPRGRELVRPSPVEYQMQDAKGERRTRSPGPWRFRAFVKKTRPVFWTGLAG